MKNTALKVIASTKVTRTITVLFTHLGGLIAIAIIQYGSLRIQTITLLEVSKKYALHINPHFSYSTSKRPSRSHNLASVLQFTPPVQVEKVLQDRRKQTLSDYYFRFPVACSAHESQFLTFFY
jgi:hypothetical protein